MILAANISQVAATTVAMPDRPGDSVVGNPPHEMKYAIAKQEDTLIDIAVDYRLGQDEIVLANPKIDRWLPGRGTQVKIPSSWVLPNASSQGIVINLPELRMYYFNPGEKTVATYAIGIGRVDWRTPLGKTVIADKTKNPSWTPPPSIIAEHAADGDVLDPYYPPGPDNPLGLFAFKLGIPGYLIHSTNKTNGVGMRVSHGCIRMYPLDIEQFFPNVPVGTQVNIVNQPIKVGWYHDTLYVEVHPELEDSPTDYEHKLNVVLDLIEKANGGKVPVIKGSALKLALEQTSGLPVAIYERPVRPVAAEASGAVVPTPVHQ